MSDGGPVTADDIDPLLAAWALDAVDDEERAEIERRLATDEALRRQADELREVAAALGAASAEDPPPRVRDAILAAVDDDPRARRADAASDEPAPVVALSPTRPRLVRWGAAAAAAVLVLGLLGAALLSARDRADRAERIAAVTGDPEARSLDLVGELGGPLRVVWSEAEDAGVIVGADIDAPDADRTLQLWFVEGDGGIESAAVFRPDPDGRVQLRVDGLVVRSAGLAVSDEPAGGSPQPTGEILAVSS